MILSTQAIFQLWLGSHTCYEWSSLQGQFWISFGVTRELPLETEQWPVSWSSTLSHHAWPIFLIIDQSIEHKLYDQSFSFKIMVSLPLYVIKPHVCACQFPQNLAGTLSPNNGVSALFRGKEFNEVFKEYTWAGSMAQWHSLRLVCTGISAQFPLLELMR